MFDLALSPALKTGLSAMTAVDIRGFLDPSLMKLQAVREHIGRHAYNYLPSVHFNTLDVDQVCSL
jgi:hypothetical protein